MEEKPALFKRLPKPIRLGLDLGRVVVGVKGLTLLYPLASGIVSATAVGLTDLPLLAKILVGTSAFLVGTAVVGQTIARWKRRSESSVDPLIHRQTGLQVGIEYGSWTTGFLTDPPYLTVDLHDARIVNRESHGVSLVFVLDDGTTKWRAIDPPSLDMNPNTSFTTSIVFRLGLRSDEPVVEPQSLRLTVRDEQTKDEITIKLLEGWRPNPLSLETP